jgi:uncharacterized protein (DUF1800 family)
MANTHAMLAPYQPTDSDPFDALKAAHLLNRCTFGGTAEEVEKVLKLGPQRAVDWLMDFPDAPAEEQDRNDTPNLSAIAGYPNDFRTVAQMFAGKSQEERKAYQQMLMQANREALQATTAWWMHRMAFGPYPMQEKLTFFWHGHFTTSAKDERQAQLMWRQNELLRLHGAGNFEAFVRAISRDPAMLDYLNNNQNRKAHPNENYARELMELFTLGIGNYTERDIKEAARAFTGWQHDGIDFVYRRPQHDDDVKSFLGRSGNFDGDDIISIILRQPACPRFIAGELFKYFAYDNTDASLASALGDTLFSNRYEMRPLLRTILTSKAFYSPQSIGVQIKGPVQLVIGTIRMLGVRMPAGPQMMSALNQMGQVPLMPPNVRGWPGGQMWINTSTLFIRYNTAVWLTGGDVPAFSRLTRKGDAGRPIGGDPVAFRPADGGSPEQVVDDWIARLIQRPVPDEKKKVLVEALGKNPDSPDAQRKVVQLIVSTPEFQLC